MREKTLLKIALIGSLAGILVLLAISGSLEISERMLSRIDATDTGRDVRVTGIVADFQNKGTVIIISLAQLEAMDVVVFNENFTLNKGDYIEVTGKIDEYEGSRQLIADRITLK